MALFLAAEGHQQLILVKQKPTTNRAKAGDWLVNVVHQATQEGMSKD